MTLRSEKIKFVCFDDAEMGYKLDGRKLSWGLLPIREIEQVVKVLTRGAVKYSPYNWQKIEHARERYYAALMRHLVAWRQGKIFDKETKQPHMAHLICCALFIMWFDNENQRKSRKKI